MPQTTEARASRSDPASSPDRAAEPATAEPAAAEPPRARGRAAAPESRVRILVCGRDKAVRETTTAANLDSTLAEARQRKATVWIDLEAPTADEVRTVAEALSLHPLLVEDITDRNQRAKIEQFDGVTHLVLFALAFPGEVTPLEIDIVLGDSFLLTVHDPGWDPREAEQLRLGDGSVLAKGPDFLLYVLADVIVDGYFPVLDRLADEIDDLQDQLVMDKPSHWSLQRLFTLKRELIELRRATSPTREIFNQLTNRDVGEIDPRHVIYFRDIYDHLIRVTDEVDNFREMVSGTIDIYLTAVNNNLSVIMKRLTGVTVILAGVGAVGGIFGMSQATPAFAGQEGFGFWLLTLASFAGAGVMLVVLRRIGWI